MCVQVITDTRVSEKQVCEEQKKLEERLLELERRGVQLETEMRRRTNGEKHNNRYVNAQCWG